MEGDEENALVQMAALVRLYLGSIRHLTNLLTRTHADRVQDQSTLGRQDVDELDG